MTTGYYGSYVWKPSCSCPGNKPSTQFGDYEDQRSHCPNCGCMGDQHNNQSCHFRFKDKVWYPTDPTFIQEKQLLDDLLYRLITAKLETK